MELFLQFSKLFVGEVGSAGIQTIDAEQTGSVGTKTRVPGCGILHLQIWRLAGVVGD